MSFSFTAGRLVADLGAGNERSYPLTLGVHIAWQVHPIAFQYPLMIGPSTGTINPSFSIRTNNSDGSMQALAVISGGSSTGASRSTSTTHGDNGSWPTISVWVPVVAVYTDASTFHVCHVGGFGSGTAATLRDIGTVHRHIYIGQNLGAGSSYVGNIAEPAIWNKVLTTQEIDDYLAGISANQIANSDLFFYNPLRQSNYNDDALHVGPTLATGGTAPTYDSQHPTIDYGSASAGRMLLLGVG